MFCSKCGKAIEEGTAFCGYCGAPIGMMASHTESMQNKMSPKESAGKKHVIVFLTAVILLAAVTVSGVFLWRQANDTKEADSRVEESLWEIENLKGLIPRRRKVCGKSKI